jgi:hypothetical protein
MNDLHYLSHSYYKFFVDKHPAGIQVPWNAYMHRSLSSYENDTHVAAILVTTKTFSNYDFLSLVQN